jgi:hypothetical protein
MRHSREEVIERVEREFAQLDELVTGLSEQDWQHPLPRPESKDPWTVKDALAHITHWKAHTARVIRGQRRPPEERGLGYNEVNHLVYLRWRERSPEEILAWHRQVQEDVLAALREAPEKVFSGRERGADWPGDFDSHSAYHRVKDIERVVKTDRNPNADR